MLPNLECCRKATLPNSGVNGVAANTEARTDDIARVDAGGRRPPREKCRASERFEGRLGEQTREPEARRQIRSWRQKHAGFYAIVDHVRSAKDSGTLIYVFEPVCVGCIGIEHASRPRRPVAKYPPSRQFVAQAIGARRQGPSRRVADE